jgi:hypothetical protein
MTPVDLLAKSKAPANLYELALLISTHMLCREHTEWKDNDDSALAWKHLVESFKSLSISDMVTAYRAIAVPNDEPKLHSYFVEQIVLAAESKCSAKAYALWYFTSLSLDTVTELQQRIHNINQSRGRRPKIPKEDVFKPEGLPTPPKIWYSIAEFAKLECEEYARKVKTDHNL